MLSTLSDLTASYQVYMGTQPLVQEVLGDTCQSYADHDSSFEEDVKNSKEFTCETQRVGHQRAVKQRQAPWRYGHRDRDPYTQAI